MKRRSTSVPHPPSNAAIGLLVLGCTLAGIFLDVLIFEALGAW